MLMYFRILSIEHYVGGRLCPTTVQTTKPCRFQMDQKELQRKKSSNALSPSAEL